MVDLIDKVPPQNPDAEKSVLGSMLIEKEAIPKTIGVLKESDFYFETHQQIFKSILELYDKNKAVDLITLAEELKKRKQIESIGGIPYLQGLINSVSTAANVDHYAKIVKEKGVLRNLIKEATGIVTECYSDSREVEKVLDKAEQSIFSISQHRVTPGFVPLSEMVEDTFETIEALFNKKDKVPGIASGFKDLDEKTTGFHSSNLIIVAGRPMMGKTSLALNIAANVAINQKKSVAIFSLEMSRDELFLRFLCSEARVSSKKVRTGYIAKRDWGVLTGAASRLSEAPIYIDDSPSLSVLEMKARARRLQTEKGLDLVIVDYLQLMPGRTGRVEHRQQELSEVSRSLKIMAKELEIPVIALSQLSRETEKRKGKDKRPVLSDLRDSGAIEQDADLVLFIYREELYDQHQEHPELAGVTEVIIGKHRHGKTNEKVALSFLQDYTRFESYSGRKE